MVGTISGRYSKGLDRRIDIGISQDVGDWYENGRGRYRSANVAR